MTIETSRLISVLLFSLLLSAILLSCRSTKSESHTNFSGVSNAVLYTMDSCPYCKKVCRFLETKGIRVETRDTRASAKHREELRQISGKTQVPCLVVDGEPLLESAAIIQWFIRHAGS